MLSSYDSKAIVFILGDSMVEKVNGFYVATNIKGVVHFKKVYLLLFYLITENINKNIGNNLIVQKIC